MIQQSWIGFVVLLDGLFTRFKLHQNFGGHFTFEFPFNSEKGLLMLYDLTVDAVEITFGVGQIMHRIQNVGFSNAIGPGDRIYTIAKFQR